MTKANENARAKVKDAERRAKRKLRRLQKKGVLTGSINPLREVDPSNTRALNNYAKSLEKFISRKTRYVAGAEGTPIRYEKYRDYLRLERRWNAVHAKYWKEFADVKTIGRFGEFDESLGTASLMQKYPHQYPYKGINYQRATPSSALKGEKDIARRSKVLAEELSPKYREKRARQLRKNLKAQYERINDPELIRLINGSTNEELIMLQERTDFQDMFYMYVYPGEYMHYTEADRGEFSQRIKDTIMSVRNVNRAAKKR